MQFKILGPLEVHDGLRLVELGRPKQRALLALLLVHANEAVSPDRLIEELWGADAPPRATASLQSYVSNLRRALEPDRPARTRPRVLVTQPPGYRLVVASGELDADSFTALAVDGHRLLEADQPAAAVRSLRDALALWRGPALADVADEPFAQVERHRLEELRAVTLEDRVSAELALGGHAAAVAELEELVGRYPFRERLHGLLMLALYRSGRQAEALRAFQAARRALDEELGIEPDRWLRQLETDILRQAPALDWTPPPSAPAPLRAGQGDPVGWDELLATKLHIPVPGADSLARPRLLQRLEEGTARELTLVCAPAGFGKTTALGEWARRSRRRVAWLSLDASDSDPARFWRYVAAALDVVKAGIRQQVAALLSGPQPPPLEAVVTLVINELAALPDEAVLVLDDFHLVEATAVHDSLVVLLERLPAQLRLVVASRGDPPLPLARWRGRGKLTELRETDLRFTRDEVSVLLRAATGLELPVASIAALTTRTEGWGVGLQLAALSLSGHADPAGFVDTFTGSHRFVLDYLTEEVLARQPEDLLRFLLETAVLDRLSGPLCDAVTGRGGSQALLEAVERANLFLVPLDGERRWWRYHHLFADLLRARLQQVDPDRVPTLHRAASAWHEAHDLADDAIRHALAAGDAERAVWLIEGNLEEQILRRSEGATFARWLAALPPDLVRARPRLSLGQAIGALVAGRADQAEPLVAAAERAEPAAASEPYQPSIGRAASILANVPAVIAVSRADIARLRGDPAGEARFAGQAQVHLTGADRLLGSLVRYHMGAADWMAGRLGAAERVLAAVVAERLAAGERYMALRACHDLGHVQRQRGLLDAAARTYERALQAAAEPGRAPPPFAGIAHVGLAEVRYERDELDAARDHATTGVALCRQFKYTPPLAAGLATLARVLKAQGDRQGALEVIDEARRVTQGWDLVDLLNPVPSQWARLLLSDGDVAAPARWVRERGIAPDDRPSYPREGEYLILTRVLLAEGRPDVALGLLGRLRDAAAAQGRVRSLLEVAVLRARGCAAVADEEGAVVALCDALTLAAVEGHVRVFLDEGPSLTALFATLPVDQQLQQASATSAARAHLTRLARASA